MDKAAAVASSRNIIICGAMYLRFIAGLQLWKNSERHLLNQTREDEAMATTQGLINGLPFSSTSLTITLYTACEYIVINKW